MTVQSLIDKLQRVKNKDERVYFVDEDCHYFSNIDNYVEIDAVIEVDHLSEIDKCIVLTD